ncbi:UDP-glycosyltransferase 88B1-like [Rutidosis leptorrhynchoides]|uniref:UDP-glycosyltransferase 88B1-like n=1 Tax=Rutidosis leptorrhynchoides TaxID=125765 RepID=UPI003A9963FF
MATIVLYPSPLMGHLISMVELGKLIIKHHPSYTISILTLTNSFNTGSTTTYIRHISATFPAITFHHLPHIPLDLDAYPSSDAIVFDLIQRSVHNVTKALNTISPCALIIDLFCTSAMAVAASINVPVYYFITSGAASVVKLLYFPILDQIYEGSFRDKDKLIYSPGMPPIPSRDMPVPVLDRNSTGYLNFLELAHYLPRSSGIITNTFDSLEPKQINAIRDGLCVQGQPTPPLYCIGPLLSDGGNDHHECLTWLDSQPNKSVVYLCFGSECLFSVDQLKNIANGLERSGHRFLWVIRSPPTTTKYEEFLLNLSLDLTTLLPDGFLCRTKDRGFVVKNWAPQVKVLSHESIGGFVTHCGWNSVLEATRAGVPMLAWPLYAEQRMNKIVMVEEMKLALPIDESDNGTVTSEEFEKRVRQLMESNEGRIVRDVLNERKKDAARAMSDVCGSSRLALAKLVESWQPTVLL